MPGRRSAVRPIPASAAAVTRIIAVDADGNGQADRAGLADGTLALFVNATAVGATVPAFDARLDRGTAPSPKMMFLADLDDVQSESELCAVLAVLYLDDCRDPRVTVALDFNQAVRVALQGGMPAGSLVSIFA